MAPNKGDLPFKESLVGVQKGMEVLMAGEPNAVKTAHTGSDFLTSEENKAFYRSRQYQ